MRECQERIGWQEFKEWIAFYGLEPFGESRADLRSGIIAATFANANRAKGQRPFTAKDFMPRFGPHEEEKPEILRRKFEMFAKLHNAHLQKR